MSASDVNIPFNKITEKGIIFNPQEPAYDPADQDSIINVFHAGDTLYLVNEAGDTLKTELLTSNGGTADQDSIVSFFRVNDSLYIVNESGDTLKSVLPVDDDTQLTQEEVQDYAGQLLDMGNVEYLISVGYDDVLNRFNFLVDDDLSLYDNSNSGFLTSEVDGSVSNEGDLTVASDAAGAKIQSNTSGSSDVIFEEGSNITITENVGTNTLTFDVTSSGGSSDQDSIVNAFHTNDTLYLVNQAGDTLKSELITSAAVDFSQLDDNNLPRYDTTAAEMKNSGLSDNDTLITITDRHINNNEYVFYPKGNGRYTTGVAALILYSTQELTGLQLL